MPRSSVSLGDLERSVMDVLWNGGSYTVREIHSVLSQERDLAYTTVMTVLDRLAKKGVADRERVGRSWRYTAAASHEELTAVAMRASFEELEPTDRRTALLHFLGEADEAAIAGRTAMVADDEQTHRPAATTTSGANSGRCGPGQ